MTVIYDYWPYDREWRHTFVPQMIVYPLQRLECNESVWIIPGTLG